MRAGYVVIHRIAALPVAQHGIGRSALFAEMDEADRRLVAVPVFLFVPFMVRLAINESIGVLGLVTTILSGDAQWSVPFAVVAILLNLRIFPRVEQMRERARRFHRVQV